MKKGLLFLAVAALSFTACDKVPVIENFGISNVFEETVVLDITDTDPSVFAKDFIIDPAGAEEFKDNLSKISSYNIKKLSYRIGSFVGDPATEGTVRAQFMDGTTAIGDPMDMGKVAFQSLVNEGTEVEIAVNNDVKNLVQQMLLDGQAITLMVAGSVTNQPMTAEIVLMVELEAVVKVE